MGEKKTLSGRVPPDTEERFQQYRERRGLNQTDAMRRLLDEGLDAVEEEQRLIQQQAEGARESQEKDIVSQTQTEAWCRDRFQTWLSGMLLSGSATLALWLSFGAVMWYPAVNASEWLPTQLIALLIFVGVVVFLAFGSGALVTGLLLRTGYAARIDLWQNNSSEQESAA